MPLPFAIPVGLLVGMTLAWLARSELARSEVPLVLARPFLVALGLSVLVFAPVVGYFAAFHGDWAYLYLVRWNRVPSALDLAFVLVAAAQIPLGFALASPWAIAKRSSRFLTASAIALGVVLAASAVTARRLGVSATYAQYQGGFGAVPIGRSPLGRGVLLSWAVLAAGYAWTAHVLRSARSRRP
ncbi:hypothetical protein AKJ09_10530 [Labilithrix luteola]|uniref:Uncharacterized protein n=1 Tax=Labilithrix luteola TaxID=1391654 RepID=A0A0K1QDY4_9BACT|nr:hypothetical protein [Labilithrix luteola]AKV03867.1 hypothetical protein AKJ09_10530 [Labilithrix luteola]